MKLKIKQIRLDRGITQKWVADQIGMKPENLHKYENNAHMPGKKILQSLAKVFNLNVEDLYE